MKRTRVDDDGNRLDWARETWLPNLGSDDVTGFSEKALAHVISVLQNEYDRRNRYTLLLWDYGIHYGNGVQIKLNDEAMEKQWLTKIMAKVEDVQWCGMDMMYNITESDIDNERNKFSGGWIHDKPTQIILSDLKPVDDVEDEEKYLKNLLKDIVG